MNNTLADFELWGFEPLSGDKALLNMLSEIQLPEDRPPTKTMLVLNYTALKSHRLSLWIIKKLIKLNTFVGRQLKRLQKWQEGV